MSQQTHHTVPAWMLAPYEEKEVRKRCQEQSNEKCKDLFEAFAQCSQRHQLLFSFKCSEEKKAMIDCVAYWGSKEVFEQERLKYVDEKIEKLEKERAAAK
ncbi:COX assembly mitochondrial protein [Trichomonascus vanleenenianus]|uniref:Cmc1p n=1 Tax=Trichomonascus vanleenenianus TaxID=2268995 RepID=UPI003ECB4790